MARGRSEGEIIEALRGVGHDIWSYDEERSSWCGDWAEPIPGGSLGIEGLGGECRVSWRTDEG